MKYLASFRPLPMVASVLVTGLLPACGGGSDHGSNADTTSVLAVSSPTNATNASGGITTITSAEQGGAGSRMAGVSAALAQFIEALASSQEAKTISAALSSVGAYPPDSATSNDSIDGTADSLSDVPTLGKAELTQVRALAASAGAGGFVKLTEQGHIFNVPAGTQIRYGDAASNRWVTKTASGYGECTDLFFRNDPARGLMKVCQKWVSTDEQVDQAAQPIWSQPAGLMPVIDMTRIPTPWIGFSGMMVQPTNEVAPGSDIGQFRTACGVAKLSFDDPIVYPGQAGKSHLHTFFGNTGVNADSTPDSLRTTGTSTCRGGIANRSSYWVPTIIDTRTGAPVVATGNGVYYKSGFELPTSVIRPIPAGLRMIAGEPGATEPGYSTYRFKCVGGPNSENDKYGAQIGNCDAGASLIQEIFFPQCWDGVNLDSPDHKSHMAYPDRNACPASHPVAIPAITFNVEYVVTKSDDPLYWRLSSDNYETTRPAGYSSHGDWFNGWKSEISDAWGAGCVMAVKECHSHLTGDGRMMY